MQSRTAWILFVLALAALAMYWSSRCSRGRRTTWLFENYADDEYENFEDEYNCSQEWATCPNGPPNCYWGDKDWNKGKCCPKPWSSPEACQDPINPATGRSIYDA
jgi:hypothetical protein